MLYKTTGIQTNTLHTSAIGSFGLYITLHREDPATGRAELQVWMYNAMDKGSFGQFASYFPLSGMERQYMWWNWTETVQVSPTGFDFNFDIRARSFSQRS